MKLPGGATESLAASETVADEAAAPSTKRRHQPRGTKRRPSGEAPPIPKQLHRSGRYWLILAGVVVVGWVLVFVGLGGVPMTRVDMAALRWMVELRSDPLTSAAQSLDALGSTWTIFAIRWAVVLALLVLKRFRHLFVALASLLLGAWITSGVAITIARPRPFGIEILSSWHGGSHPSRPVAALAGTLIGVCYTLVVPGRPRTIAKWITGAVILVFGLARLYLGVDHPSDVIVGVVLGVTIPLVAFRLFCPNEVFPVTYGRRRGAHLDVGGRRGEAIVEALKNQLGLDVVELKPFGLAGSGGSTPLRLKLAGDPPRYLFAKLYARNHLRADRWYKLGRTLLYGRLEDEGSFSTVRRLVQYEDYMLRVMRDADLQTAEPYGFVEITPEREYVIVTEFVDGAEELLDAEVTDQVIAEGLRLVRTLWDAGLAHRDIKPSNLLVRNGKMHLIDVAFAEIRPTPWRQAVDLANMMLVLAFRTDADRVYQRALEYFTPDEIAEAFAATHGVTMPSQSRSLLKKDSRNLLARFRELAPKRRPISIQRWSIRRLALTVGVALTAFFAVGMTVSNLSAVGLVPLADSVVTISSVMREPGCTRVSDPLILMAQSVPTASKLPCLNGLPVGWKMSDLQVRDRLTRFFLDSDRAGFHAMEVRLTESCDLRRATEIVSDEADTHRYEQVDVLGGDYVGRRYYTFEGGCVTYLFDFRGEGRTTLANEATLALGFFERERVSERVNELGFTL